MTNKNLWTFSTTDPKPESPEIEIKTKSREYNGYFNIDRYSAELTWPADGLVQKLNRFVFERGDAVAVLLLDKAAKKVVMVRQLRMPPVCRGDQGWIIEIVAGSMTPDEDPAKVAEKEVLEEIGVKAENFDFKGVFYLSPGGVSERCFLYFADVDSREIAGNVAGEDGTDERTVVESFDISAIPGMLARGEVRDAKTIIALQMLLLNMSNGD